MPAVEAEAAEAAAAARPHGHASRRRMLFAVDGSIGFAAARFAQRLSALPAISDGRRLWMIYAIHC